MWGDILETNRDVRLKGRRRQAAPALDAMLERLEGRLLLNGLTVITHGYELSNGTPTWLTNMGTAIASEIGPGTAIYKMTLSYNTSTNQAYVSGFAPQPGSPTIANSTDAQTVLLIDWSQDSGTGVETDYFTTTQLASLITPYLISPIPSLGIAAPLAQGAIQLIGHSRGASLVSEISKDLGQDGIWVDQLTTLDPHPIESDATVAPTSNVVFADNYYQTEDLTIDGAQVNGAANFGPLSLSGGYAAGTFDLEGEYHENVHLFYQGTIGDSSSDGTEAVPSSWYGNERDSIGYDYSLIEGGSRPNNGIGNTFGGAGARVAVATSGTLWANIGMLSSSASSVVEGGSFNATYDYEYDPSTSNVQFYLDSDQNPYNGNSVALGSADTLLATNGGAFRNSTNLLISAPLGKYFLEARITGGSTTRFAYAPGEITVTVGPPAQLGFVTQPPASVVAGMLISPAINVDIEDVFGNVVNTDASNVTLTVLGGSNGTPQMVQAVGGVATFGNISLKQAGNYTLQLSDGSLATAASALTVTQGVTTVPVPQVNSSYTFGQAISFSDALVSTAGITIPWTGVAMVEDQNGQAVGNATVSSAGVANFTLSGIVAGNHVYTLAYAGDTNHTTGESSNFTLNVMRASTTTVLTASASFITYGQPVTLTAAVAGNGGTPSGNVTFWDGSTSLGTVALNGNGTATLGNFTYSAGAAFRATYAGDSDFLGSNGTSSAVVSMKSPTESISSNATPAPGQSFTLTATLSPLLRGTYSGTVQFFDKNKRLGTPVAIASNGVAALSEFWPALGKHLITAVYSGDLNNNPSTSFIFSQSVVRASTTALITSGPNSLASTSTGIFTVSVTLIIPLLASGSVKLMTTSGKNLGTAKVRNGQATYTLPRHELKPGTYSIFAIYLGDKNNFPSSMSNEWALVVS